MGERDKYQSMAQNKKAISAVPMFNINDKFVLNKEDASYTLSLEVQMPIDNVLLQVNFTISIIDLGQHCFRKWLVAWWQHAITWVNVEFSSMTTCAIDLKGTSWVALQILIIIRDFPLSQIQDIWEFVVRNVKIISSLRRIYFQMKSKFYSKCLKSNVKCLNSLWPSDTLWHHRSGSAVAQLMTCRLTAHAWTHVLCLISEVLWHSTECSFTASAQVVLYNEFENDTFKITATSRRGPWVEIPQFEKDIMSDQLNFVGKMLH